MADRPPRYRILDICLPISYGAKISSTLPTYLSTPVREFSATSHENLEHLLELLSDEKTAREKLSHVSLHQLIPYAGYSLVNVLECASVDPPTPDGPQCKYKILMVKN